MAATNRTILSVIEVTPDVGPPFLYVDWSSEIMENVDPDGKDTDKILDLVEGLLAPVED
jgi:hypothetical protein